jgi:hypothetical protein
VTQRIAARKKIIAQKPITLLPDAAIAGIQADLFLNVKIAGSGQRLNVSVKASAALSCKITV